MGPTTSKKSFFFQLRAAVVGHNTSWYGLRQKWSSWAATKTCSQANLWVPRTLFYSPLIAVTFFHSSLINDYYSTFIYLFLFQFFRRVTAAWAGAAGPSLTVGIGCLWWVTGRFRPLLLGRDGVGSLWKNRKIMRDMLITFIRICQVFCGCEKRLYSWVVVCWNKAVYFDVELKAQNKFIFSPRAHCYDGSWCKWCRDCFASSSSCFARRLVLVQIAAIFESCTTMMLTST